MEGSPGTKVLGRIRAGAAKALGFIRSPFEDRVAVLLLIRDPGTPPALRVLGARLDKHWSPPPRPTVVGRR
jgi:hypothetical protein